MTTREVMTRLSVKDPDTVYALRKAGKILGNQLGRVWRFDPDSVDAFLRGDVPASEPVSERATVVRRPPSRPPRPGAWAAGVERIIRR